jgi:hypothetical protein
VRGVLDRFREYTRVLALTESAAVSDLLERNPI